MKHARKDYMHIQDPSGKIPEDEPVFLIRGQDILGPATVRYWASIAVKRNVSPEMIEMAQNQAREMEAWQAKHGRKDPDLHNINSIEFPSKYTSEGDN